MQGGKARRLPPCRRHFPSGEEQAVPDSVGRRFRRRHRRQRRQRAEGAAPFCPALAAEGRKGIAKIQEKIQAKMAGSITPQRKLCVFCGKTAKMTNEHVWGKWLKQCVRQDMRKHSFVVSVINQPGIPAEENIYIRAGDPLGSKVRVVCERCNNTWLSSIQRRAKPHLLPLINGEPTTLGHDAQHAVAAWATMATMTAEFLLPDPMDRVVTQAERAAFMASRMPSPDWRIWIGRYRRVRWLGQWVHASIPVYDAAQVAEVEATGRPQCNMQTSTFVVGELYVHVLSGAHIDFVRDWHWTAAPKARAMLPLLWPRSEDFIAWPINAISDHEAILYSRAFFNWVDAIRRTIRR